MRDEAEGKYENAKIMTSVLCCCLCQQRIEVGRVGKKIVRSWPQKDEYDHQLLVGLVNLVGSLAQKLTGETPLLCLESRDGPILHVYPQTAHVGWRKGGDPPERCRLHDKEPQKPIEAAAASGKPCDHQERPSKLPSSSGSPHAND
jgi:hypothetical protein